MGGMTVLTHRIATQDDIPTISVLMERAIESLQRGFLSPEEIAASRSSMGLDTQLIADGTYFLVEADGRLAGCGGWSRRATLYGGSHSAALRDDRLLDPSREPARVRAMYTDPAFVRRGIGRLILSLAEDAARAAGFARGADGDAGGRATVSGERLHADRAGREDVGGRAAGAGGADGEEFVVFFSILPP